MDLPLPEPYRARPYRGRVDHPAMAPVLCAYREYLGDPEHVTAEQLDVAYSHLEECDPDHDIAVVEDGAGAVVGYVRVSHADTTDGVRHCVLFAPTRPDHLDERLFGALVDGQERHLRARATAHDGPACYRGYAPHPGPGRPASGESAWWEDRGYVAAHFGASLVRPHLRDVPTRRLPDGVELRPVTEDQVRRIWEAHVEAFRGEWDWQPPTEERFAEFVEDPYRDISLWKVAWAGDEVVGQVKSYVNADENRERGYRRGYTEEISTHAEWRNRGVAGALLAASLVELRERGMDEAALGVDTDNPGGAFHLYQSLGFELRAYEAVYEKPVG